MEAPGRDDLDPMQLELLRSGGSLRPVAREPKTRTGRHGPSRGRGGVTMAPPSGAFTGVRGLGRSNRVLIGAALVLLLGAATASTILAVQGDDPAAAAAP